MKLIDLHCDTVDKLMDYKDSNLYDNEFSVDIKKLKRANSLAQVFALYFDLNSYRDDPFGRFNNMADRFFKDLKYCTACRLRENTKSYEAKILSRLYTLICELEKSLASNINLSLLCCTLVSKAAEIII